MSYHIDCVLVTTSFGLGHHWTYGDPNDSRRLPFKKKIHVLYVPRLEGSCLERTKLVKIRIYNNDTTMYGNRSVERTLPELWYSKFEGLIDF